MIMQVVNQCEMSLKSHDDATIAWCQAHRVTYEAFDAMKGCDFSSPVIKGIATKHGVGVSQVRTIFCMPLHAKRWYDILNVLYM